MDGQQFDRLTQQLSQAFSRRRFGTLLAALGLHAGLGAAADVAAKKKKKKKKKPKKCKNGAVKCGSACVDTTSNAAHCGGCGQGCGAGQSCVTGTCQGGGGCASDRELCGTECVNLDNNEAHCGECNNACTGELTCIDGACGCAEDTRCGTECVDTDTDLDHCGGCGDACASDQTCSGGQCDDPVEECILSECNPSGSSLGPECRDGRCVCPRSGDGICVRSSGAKVCDVCCPGGDGSAACPGDRVCVPSDAFWPSCKCPPGTEQCRDTHASTRCTRDFNTDYHRCGTNCIDCATLAGPPPFCCGGACGGGAPPGVGPDPGRPCNANCQPCPENRPFCCKTAEGSAAPTYCTAQWPCPSPPQA